MEFAEWMAWLCHVCQFLSAELYFRLLIVLLLNICWNQLTSECRLPRLNKFQICNSEYKMEIACYPIIVPSVSFFFLKRFVALLWYQSLSLIESNCLFSLFFCLQNVIFICRPCFCRLFDESSIKSSNFFWGTFFKSAFYLIFFCCLCF